MSCGYCTSFDDMLKSGGDSSVEGAVDVAVDYLCGMVRFCGMFYTKNRC